jgi:UDP-3-O-[3-hydroxymyristoyl] glucosamine N-acyltransferase
MGILGQLWKRISDPKGPPASYVISEITFVGQNVKIGPGTHIGYGNPEDGAVRIGNNVTIGAFCLIHYGATIGDGVHIDDYCKIGADSVIGPNTRVLYGKHVYDEANIGANCIVGGHVADRTVIEDDVTFMGEIAHSHRHPNDDWDSSIEPSPIIKKGSVVGVNAILIGGVEIGPCAYIGAGEIVRVNVDDGMCFIKGESKPLKHFRGIFKSRCK